MAIKENNVYKGAMLALGRKYPKARLFRNNCGSAWTGPGFNLRRGQVYTAQGGERVITQPRPVEFGLVKGSGDGIGWHSLEITPDMVGKRVAIFLSIETKAINGRVREEQLNWLRAVNDAGGIALILHDPDQLELHIPEK